jgi:ribosome-binding factor A
MEGHRNERVVEALREELDEIINYELSDPRIHDVRVTEVFLPPGGKQAHIRLSLGGSAEEQEQTLEALRRASGHIRRLVLERIEVYRLPEMRFFADISPQLREKLGPVIRRIRRGRPKGDGG